MENVRCNVVKMLQNGGKKKKKLDRLLNWAAKTESQQATQQESHLINQSPQKRHYFLF